MAGSKQDFVEKVGFKEDLEGNHDNQEKGMQIKEAWREQKATVVGILQTQHFAESQLAPCRAAIATIINLLSPLPLKKESFIEQLDFLPAVFHLLVNTTQTDFGII